MVRFRLRTPRDLATRLRERARLEPREVEEYLDQNPAQWEALAAADPHDAADILEELGEDAAFDLIADLEPAEAAEVLDELRADLAAGILAELDSDSASRVLAAMAPEEAADVIGELNNDARSALLETMEIEAAREVAALLSYPADSAGGLMTTDVAALPVGITAGEAIEVVRQMHEELEDLSYVYITDDEHRLVGVLSFRDLVFNRPGLGLDEVMIHTPVSVTPLADREEVAELTQRYNLFGLPVVEEDGRLLGMVTTEAVLQAVQEEASEDFAAAVGAGASETAYSTVSRSVRNRVPWLAVNLTLALGNLFIMQSQTSIIEAHPRLAILMPLVATLGGNAGGQSLAVIIRALATDDVPRSEIPGILWRQVAVGAVSGVIIGALAFAVAWAIDPAVAVVVAIGSLVNLVIATLAGSGIPLALRGLGFDPALAANIFVTLITDLAGFGGFLAIAAVLL